METRWYSPTRFWRDLRLAFRLHARHRASSLAAVTALCLGIGPTTAIFSVVHATLLAPLPYPQSDRLVIVWSQGSGGRNVASAGDFLEWKQRATAFDALDAFTYRNFNLGTAGDREAIPVRMATPGGYGLHHVPVWLGRDFLPDENQPGKDHVVLLSHELWSRRFGGDRGIIGREIRLDAEPYTVIGILPPGIFDRLGADAWLPLTFTPEQRGHDRRWLVVMGRLKPDVTLPRANGEIAAIAGALAREHPASNAGWSASVEPLQNNFLNTSTRTNLWLLLAAVTLVVLIACVDVANLLLTRATTRTSELAVRVALGASRAQLFRMTITESLVLAVIGGVLGVLSAVWLLRAFLTLLPPFTLPAEADPRLSAPVLLFAGVMTLGCGLLFGAAPARRAGRTDLNQALRQGGRGAVAGQQRGLRLLVVAELALAVSLLAGAALAMHSFWNRTQVDLGVNPDGVLVFDLLVPQGYMTEASRIDGFYRALVERLEASPGVSHAAVTSMIPLLSGIDTAFDVAGRPSDRAAGRPSAALRTITPGYFDTFGARVLRGRAFNAHDDVKGARVVMVNERFAHRFLDGLDPLRERLLIAPPVVGTAQVGPPEEWRIVGVFHDVANGQPFGDPERPEIYLPFSQRPSAQALVAVRTTGDPEMARPAAAAAVRALDPTLPLSRVVTLERIVRERLAPDRLNMALFGGLATVALLLAAVGVYGVMAFLVAQRTSEIGLRMALGASRGQVIARILREGLTLALTGLGVGLAGAFAVGLAMRSTLYGTGTLSPLVALEICVILLVTALAACLGPARRASAVDPLSALRQG